MNRILLCIWGISWAVSSAFAHPGSGIAVDDNGRVYFTDSAEGVWRADQSGDLKLVSRSAMHWMAIDHKGVFANVDDEFGEWFGRLTPRGERPTLISCSDFPCVIGGGGNLYFAKMHGLSIMRLTPSGRESVFVSPEEFGIDVKRPWGVNGIACGSKGTLYLVALDSASRTEGTGEHVLFSIGMDRSIRAVARNFVPRTLAALHPEVRPQYSRGLAVDAQGNVLVAVTGSRCVIKVTPKGAVSTLFRTVKPWSPTGVDVLGEDLYVLEYDDETPTEGRNWPLRVKKVDKDGTVSMLARIRNPSDKARQ